MYDASAHAHNDAPSLNDCLQAGPPLQNQLWSVLTRNRFHSGAVTGDIRKAFLQIKIRQAERDSLRFHWIKDVHSSEVEILRFTRVVVGLAPSPFLLIGVIQQHLDLWRPRLPESVSEALKSLYVDDFISGGPTVTDAKKLKHETAEVFADARFELHKWHSNVPDLETTSSDDEPTFAKQQLENKLNRGKSKLLGLPWDKVQDTLTVVFPAVTAELTKRGVLANLAKVYDPLGLVSLVMLEGKIDLQGSLQPKTRLGCSVARRLGKSMEKLGTQIAKQCHSSAQFGNLSRTDQRNKVARLRGCQWIWHECCDLCCCYARIWRYTRSGCCQVSSCQTRANHSSARTDIGTHGCQSGDKRTQSIGRISARNRHPVLVG